MDISDYRVGDDDMLRMPLDFHIGLFLHFPARSVGQWMRMLLDHPERLCIYLFMDVEDTGKVVGAFVFEFVDAPMAVYQHVWISRKMYTTMPSEMILHAMLLPIVVNNMVRYYIWWVPEHHKGLLRIANASPAIPTGRTLNGHIEYVLDREHLTPEIVAEVWYGHRRVRRNIKNPSQQEHCTIQ